MVSPCATYTSQISFNPVLVLGGIGLKKQYVKYSYLHFISSGRITGRAMQNFSPHSYFPVYGGTWPQHSLMKWSRERKIPADAAIFAMMASTASNPGQQEFGLCTVMCSCIQAT